MSWISANLAPLMFAGMVLFMLIGYPAAFSLGAVPSIWSRSGTPPTAG